ncbi:4-demethylwyosine synthase TYW1 [archaeon]|jgi:tRNA wybutosine-synthesizing protein 1|nr:4-demethylwyosine synthase TYW1 [archaeon]MBT4242164.1 4-demethylwyosine synthase TYW1 [archaeon]MBT4417852.1 4-demethylwyosine synthase TYW1 [archaeon]
MINKEKAKKNLEKQGYRVVGNNSAVKICNWTKKSLTDKGVCYKEKFYGIKSHLCAQISCTLFNCQNKCIHCWRDLNYTEEPKLDNFDNPQKIINESILAQRKLIEGFKGNSKTNLKKFEEAQEPMQFAISLTGEPTLYPKLGEFINELRKLGKTSFVVTNGLSPEVLKKLSNDGNLPTQLYLSMNAPNEELFLKWHRSSVKDAWKKFNESLELFSELKTRKVIRMTLVKGRNMLDSQLDEYCKMIKKASPDFIEVKGYMSVGYARERMGYEEMPNFEEIKEYAEKIVDCLKSEGYKILDDHEFSRVVLIGKDKDKMKIQKI